MNIVLLIALVIISPYAAGLIAPYLIALGTLLVRLVCYLFILGFNTGAKPFYYVFGTKPSTQGETNERLTQGGLPTGSDRQPDSRSPVQD